MLYQKFSPSTALQPFIQCYFVWEYRDQLADSLVVHSPPNGLAGIVCNYGNPYQALNEKGVWEQVPTCFVAGQFTRNYSLCLSGRTGMIGVAFLPAGLSYLLGIPMIEFTDKRVDLNLVLGAESRVLEQQILDSTTSFQRITVLEKFLLSKLQKSASKIDIIDHALDNILQHKGLMSISKLSDAVCISPRQFRRRFIEKVGISPKLLSRIKRFNYISNLSFAASTDWVDMVHEGGYYDQAHFIRDFSDFSGKTPSEFINYKRALSDLVSA